jgi:hypothetical protein
MSALLAGKLQTMIYPIHERHRTIPAAAAWACLSNPPNHTRGCGMGLPHKSSDVVPDEESTSHGGSVRAMVGVSADGSVRLRFLDRKLSEVGKI